MILKEVETSHELGDARNEINATSIRFGEPSPKLKAIPALYTERKPSDVNRLHFAATGQGKWGPAGLQILNRYYSAFRK